MRFLAIPAVFAALLLGGCSLIPGTTPSPTPTTFRMLGAMSVPGQRTMIDGKISKTGCIADDGYADISIGAQVTVTDPSKKVVGVGTLTKSAFSDSDATCMFAFSVPDLPNNLKFYGVHVGNENRGIITFTNKEARVVALSIG